MSVTAETLFPLVSGNLASLSLFATRHTDNLLAHESIVNGCSDQTGRFKGRHISFR